MLTAFQRDALLAAETAVSAPWAPADTFIGLYESITDMGVDTTLDDLVLPPGSLATAIAVTAWTAAHVKADGRAMRDSDRAVFTPADYTENTTIAGVYISDAAEDGNLLDWWPIGTPIELVDETSTISVILRVVVDPNGGPYIDVVVMNG